MTTILLLNVSAFFLLSVTAQLALTFVFAREAITTQQGTLCRVKCSLAACSFCLVAAVLIWFTFISPVQ